MNPGTVTKIAWVAFSSALTSSSWRVGSTVNTLVNVTRSVPVMTVMVDAVMSQGQTVGPLEDAVGYALKQAATALRAAMERRLHPLDLTVRSTPALSCWGNGPACPTPSWRGARSSRASR